MSGRGVLPIALKCIKEIREAVDVPLIGCGGVATLDNVKAIRREGASIIGIGSALTGMNSLEVAEYFSETQSGLDKDEPTGGELITVDMDFERYTLVSNEKVCEDISILTFDRKVGVQAGEFVYAWIPGLGEKPFSALTDDPFALVVIDVGIFTSELLKLEPGSKVYVRGPHGVKVAPPENAKVVVVAGGTGLAAVYQLARDFGNAEVFLGARTSDRLYFKDECAAIANTHIATDDGSEGFYGVVTVLLDDWLKVKSEEELLELVFYNCGPAPMVHAAIEVQRRYVSDDQIFSAIDYLTKCGVGICGACHSPDGRRLCVDGPFLSGSL
jgi:dihydroorotate dehydrogenase (NAD+) catalytic subunit